MMRPQRLLVLIAGPLFLVGCSGTEPMTHPAATAPIKPSAPTVGEPFTTEPTKMALIHKGKTVTVGMSADAALKVFQDVRSGGFEADQLPPGFAEPYRARSWEDGQHGFGVILYNDRVVSAMYQEEVASFDRLKEFVLEYRAVLNGVQPQLIQGKRVDYWIWDKDDQRVVICGFEADPNRVKITACMGDSRVLDAIGMSYERAIRDQAKVDAQSVLGQTPRGSAK